MKIVDKGVLKPSFMDFTIPSNFAKSALYYVPQFGHFYCNNEYHISRGPLDLFLFIYICDGSLTVNTKGKQYIAQNDEIILLDCRQNHEYFCTKSVDFIWFHFNGNNSRQYAQYLYEQKGMHFAESYIPKLKITFEQIISGAQAMIPNEHYLSQNIGQIFSLLAAPPTTKPRLNHPFVPALEYIANHYNEDIDLYTLCNLCNLSISHFIRGKKTHTGTTPHEYLLSYRLREAKQLLITSSFTIEEISEKCGFNSASHFARAFRKAENISPTQFRRLPF